MEPTTITIQLAPPDLERFSRFVSGRRGLSWSTWVTLIFFGFLIVSSAIARTTHPPYRSGGTHEMLQGTPLEVLTTFWPVAALAALVFFRWRAGRPNHAESYKKSVPGIFQPATYRLLENGLHCESERGEVLNYWHAIDRFVETEQDFYIMLAPRNGHVLPKHCFPNLESAAIFANQIRILVEEHRPAAYGKRLVQVH